MTAILTAAPVFIVLTDGGFHHAKALRGLFPGAEIHGLAGRVDGADLTFTTTAAHLRELFLAGRPLIAICAAGIVIRTLAPVITDKRSEPPVIAVAEDGSAVVPLLGGHRGANAMAADLAAQLGINPAITTAGDVSLGVALDAPPKGWRVANPDAAKRLAATLLAGKTVPLRVNAGDASWLTQSDARFSPSADGVGVTVTDQTASTDDLVLHPPVLAVGVGCERGCAPDELITLVRKTLADAGLAEGAVAAVVSIDVKADEVAVHELAAALDVPARFFDAATLEMQTPRLITPSDVVFAEVGCHGVSEGAALAAVGQDDDGGALIVAKTKSARATCAVARLNSGIDAATLGKVRGRLRVVGLGPGKSDWRLPEATRAISEATDVVGYKLYLDLITDLVAGKNLHDSPLAQEEARARLALDLAAQGRSVVLVCSGDAGIFALATLVYELLDRENRAHWNRIDLAVVPGVSALQAAAARIGAPLGHDFCAISLSDLLTPWDDIKARVAAAGQGDFVIAFYNPVSKRRRTQLAEAREILLATRSPQTPVILARKLGRDGEEVRVTTLGELRTEDADMLTLVMVGSSRTRHVVRGEHTTVYTPRGYASKMGPLRAEVVD